MTKSNEAESKPEKLSQEEKAFIENALNMLFMQGNVRGTIEQVATQVGTAISIIRKLEGL